MARITVEDCIDKFESRFELVLVAANRARKIHSGESPTVEKNNDKNTVIALREIADETIPVDDLKEKLVQEYQAVSMQNEEDLSLEYSNTENENNNDEGSVEDYKDNINEQKDLVKEEDNTLLDNEDSNLETDKEVSNSENNKENQTDSLNINSEEEKI